MLFEIKKIIDNYTFKMRKRNSGIKFLIVLGFFITYLLPKVYGQVTPFKKSVMDSVHANEFNVSLAFTFNSGNNGTKTLTTGTEIGLLYARERSKYQLAQSSYFNQIDKFSTDNRFAAMVTASLFDHDSVGSKVVENRIYPEPFGLFSYDANRGLNWRWQLGGNIVYAFKPTKIFRIKIGAGLLYEMENWQMIKHNQLDYIDTLSEEDQQYIFETVGITREGKYLTHNIRANVYSNLMFAFTKTINLNAFFDIQMPFIPPFKGLPQLDVFPLVTKRYPRFTTDINLTFKIWEKVSFITSFTCQYDKGNLPTYAPAFIYAFSEGLQVDL